MFKKIRKRIRANYILHQKLYKQCKELEWAHIYHDSIRGIGFLEELSLNVGRYAGNYAFFYVLKRILGDLQPKSIVEFGLGESTKFISTYLDNNLSNSELTTVEHDPSWIKNFSSLFNLSDRVSIVNKVLTVRNVDGVSTKVYERMPDQENLKYDLYVIDGPFGSSRFSRYNIVDYAEVLTSEDDFIIIVDDYHRAGEQETANVLLSMFEKKRVQVRTKVYEGNKSFFLIATKKYFWTTSL